MTFLLSLQGIHMSETVVIKGVGEDTYRSFKGEAIKSGLKIGEAASGLQRADACED